MERVTFLGETRRLSECKVISSILKLVIDALLTSGLMTAHEIFAALPLIAHERCYNTTIQITFQTNWIGHCAPSLIFDCRAHKWGENNNSVWRKPPGFETAR